MRGLASLRSALPMVGDGAVFAGRSLLVLSRVTPRHASGSDAARNVTKNLGSAEVGSPSET